MSTQTFTFSDADELTKHKDFMSHQFSKLQEAMEENDDLDVDTMCDLIESFFMDSNLYKVSKAKKKATKEEATTKSKRKSKKDKDPNRPKKAPTSYILWLKDNRQQIIKDHFTDEDGNLTIEGKENVSKVGAKAGEIWRELSDEDKEPYKTKSLELQEQYKRDKEAYESSSPSPEPVDDSSETESVECAKPKAKKTPAKKSSGKKTPTKKTSGKKSSGKKTPTKKTSGKKTSGKKSSGKKSSGKKTAAKKGKAKAKNNSDDEFESPVESDDENGAGPAKKSVNFEEHESESSDDDSD
jgi:hypothetical protein